MNFAGVRRLPMVFVIDNNQFAYSTPTHLNFASVSLAARGPAYGFEGVVVDGTDVLAVYREAKTAIERARSGGGPTVLELMTMRMEGHAVHDDAAYVPPELIEQWAAKDPVRRFEAWMREHAELSDDELSALEEQVEEAIADAVRRADASAWPDPDTLEDGVYAG
jgi:TPP-dependent pyruvate/acetoin dehydrogenase alpha subunit